MTQNLPVRAKKMDPDDVFRVFVMAIFYVGKGKRSRPYAHLNEALQSPGGGRTSLSPETRKSTASLEELRDVLSLVKLNSAV